VSATVSPDLPRPVEPGGAFTWARRRLFGSIGSTLTTLVLGAVSAWGLWSFIEWAWVNAVFTVAGSGQEVDTSACRAVEGEGACWAILPEKLRFILFGRYQYDEQWRPALCIAGFIALYAASTVRRLWGWRLLAIWVVGSATIIALMAGGFAGLRPVPTDLWGGLPVTLILATFGLAAAFPLAIAVALCRRAEGLVLLRALCRAYVEAVRALPIVSVLFMASVMVPLLLPEGLNVDKLLRAQLAFTLFAAAYLSESIRGALQAIPAGQYEAAEALGLGYWRRTLLVILPQALRIALPSLVNTFLGIFKDTSLVLIIGILDLLTAGQNAVLEPAWAGFSTEVYLFVGAIYFAFCTGIARFGRRLEREGGR
jgi:general L-amino acid transport system permease protein